MLTTRRAARAALATRPPGFCVIFIPDRGMGHYVICPRGELAAFACYELVAVN